MSETLNLGNGNWATKEDSLLAYNSENGNFKPLAFNFTRASSATVVNKAGLIETVGSGEPRIDFSNDAKGALLLEPTRSNLVTYSEDFSQGYWTKSGSFVNITSEVAPDGSIDSVYNLTQGNNLYTGGITGVEYTISFYVKSNGQGKDNFKLRLGDNQSPSIIATDDWVRYEFTATPTTSVFGLVIDSFPNSEWDILIWGAQVEQGSYATSYIPTSGGVVTRNSDSCSQTVPSGIIGQTEGTMYCEIITQISTANNWFQLTDGTPNNWIFIGLDVSSIRAYVRFNSVTVFDNSSITVTNGVPTKIALAYKSGSIALYINGTEIAISSSTFTPTTLIDKVFFGNLVSPPNDAAKYKQAKLYNTRLSNAELINLTTL